MAKRPIRKTCSTLAAAQHQPIGVPDTVNPVFVVAAAVALLLTLGLVWILAAQTFGPNAAITGYTAMKGPDIAPPPGLVSIR